jgi:Family of unknown function (DUF5996)
MASESPLQHAPWPELPYSRWQDTCATLQLWTQIVGKIRLSCTPWVNHSWNSTLYVTARGLTTLPMECGGHFFQIDFDFIDHDLRIQESRGAQRTVELRPRSVASFYTAVMTALADLGIRLSIHTMPNEIADAVPFDRDEAHAAYDPVYAQRFWRVLLLTAHVFTQFRSGFIGKVSPVHFFWGSFDLAVSRFSGRPAPPHPGGVVNLPDAVTREAYSHEVSSAGFWPGNGGLGYPAYYSYTYPEPAGFRSTKVEPEAAAFNSTLGEFLLAYDAVRLSPDPTATLLSFLETTYRAAADAAHWDRAALECDPGVPGVPRRV